ncbi:DUF192 domain-containing protein [Candidatus Woesearchaeota archaeon]|nr:DUF192 domain-containing protein [Candidatus Woesearchaeota archaeon]
MLVRNATKKRVIADNARLCNDIFSKFIGLMLSKKHSKTLIFKFNEEKTISLHMFFVFYPIDVLFLGKNKIVVDKKENFKPFRFYKSKRKAMYAIELPNGTIKKTKTSKGDNIKF